MFYFCIAVGLLFAAHIARMLRTHYVLSDYVTCINSSYLRALSVGYIAEFFSPIRISDLVRTYFFAKNSRTPWSMGLALAVIERLFDLIIMCALLMFWQIHSLFIVSMTFVVLAVVVCINTPPLKGCYFKIASIFNDNLKNHLLRLYWALYRLTNGLFLQPKKLLCFILLSLLMWSMYLASAYTVAVSLRFDDLPSLLQFQFSGYKSVGIWNITQFIPHFEALIYLLYIILPVFFALLLSFSFSSKMKFSKTTKNMIPFLSHEQSIPFFEVFFSRAYSKEDEMYFLHINDYYQVRDLSAASEAKTYLLQREDDFLVRKIGLNTASKKLKAQYDWIANNNHLPLPRLLSSHEGKNIFAYDMEYFAGGETCFTAVHRLPVEKTWSILKSVLDKVTEHYESEAKNNPASLENLRAYLGEKISHNLRVAEQNETIKSFAEFTTLLINNLELPNPLLYEKELLSYAERNLAHESQQLLHGDLTVDNILVDAEGRYLVIDSSPALIDIYCELSKLFQSLHGKYEFVKNLSSWKAENGSITYPLFASAQYDSLFNEVKEYILSKYGARGLKAVYFYETVCHFRTMSYMTRLGRPQAVLMLPLAAQAFSEWRKL